MKLKHRSFASKLSFYIVIGTALLFLAMFAAVTILAIRSIKDEASESASKTLDATIAKVENTMQQVELATQNLAWVVMADINDADGMFTIGSSALKANDILYGNSIAFEPDFYPSKGEYYMVYSFKGQDGVIETSQTGGYDYDYFNMEWYQGAKLLGKPYWSEPYFDEGGGEAMMTTYTVPLYGKNGEFIGVVTGDILLEKLTSIVAGFQAFEGSFNALLSNTGTYLSHKDPRLVFNHTMISSALAINSAELLEAGMEIRHNDRGYKEFKDDNNKRNFVVYGHLSNGWTVGIICTINSLFKKSNQFGLIMLLAILLGLYLVYFINKKLINRLTQPITEFAYSAQTIAKGNFSARIPDVNSEDELKQLHDSLAYMEKSIDSYISELRSTTASNERFSSELHIATSVQMSMLTRVFPQRDDLDVFARLKPAKEVGGDMYDVFLKDDDLYFVVGDVSGKGVPAALYMAISRSAFRFITGLGLDVNEIVSRINNAFADGNERGMFITMFAAKLNMKTRELTFCNAGHNPILIIHPDGKPEYLHAKPNLAAGLFPDFPYQSETITLEKGTRLFIYTDGVTEAENALKELYGEDRLLEFAASEPVDESGEDFVAHLRGSMIAFTKENEQNDDITMMSVLLK